LLLLLFVVVGYDDDLMMMLLLLLLCCCSEYWPSRGTLCVISIKINIYDLYFIIIIRFTPKHVPYHFLGVLRMLTVLCILNALRDHPAPQVNG
jgi:hypothetical protein